MLLAAVLALRISRATRRLSQGVAEIEKGVLVWVPPGVFHATESDGPDPLELVCFFSPPDSSRIQRSARCPPPTCSSARSASS